MEHDYDYDHTSDLSENVNRTWLNFFFLKDRRKQLSVLCATKLRKWVLTVRVSCLRATIITLSSILRMETCKKKFSKQNPDANRILGSARSRLSCETCHTGWSEHSSFERSDSRRRRLLLMSWILGRKESPASALSEGSMSLRVTIKDGMFIAVGVRQKLFCGRSTSVNVTISR